MIPFYPLEGVAGVDDEAGLGGDPGVVVGRVGGHQEDPGGFLSGTPVRRGAGMRVFGGGPGGR